MSLHANIKPALTDLQNIISRITLNKASDLHDIISRMDFADLNKALYRCDQEERDDTMNRFGVYDVPGYGPLVYAGLQGDTLQDLTPNEKYINISSNFYLYPHVI